jgi:tetratricopeptide (TPR) repeat protein
MKKICCTLLLWACVSAWCLGQDNFTRGQDLFMQNKPAEAVVYLENAITEDPGRVQAFLYLGIAYEQLHKTDEAIAVYRQVLGRAGDLTATVAFNLGNAYFRKGLVSDAEVMYTRALAADIVYASAYLGRANTRVRRGALHEAIADYEHYLLLNPNSPQRPTIERLTNYIRAEAAEAERRRLVAEEVARLEAARRQALLDEVNASLQGAAGASQGLSTGAEDVENYKGEFELE